MINYKRQNYRLSGEQKQEIIIKFKLDKLNDGDLDRDDIKKYIQKNFINMDNRIVVK